MPFNQRFSDPTPRDFRPLARRIQGYENTPLEASPTPLRSRLGDYGAGAENPIPLETADSRPQWGYNYVPEALFYYALGLAPNDPNWHRVVLIEHNSYFSSQTQQQHRNTPWTFPQLYKKFFKRHEEVWPMLAFWRREMKSFGGKMEPIPRGESWHRGYFIVDGEDGSQRTITEEDQDWLINDMHTVNAPRHIAGPIIERFNTLPRSRFIPASSTSSNLRIELSDDEEGDKTETEPTIAVADGDATMTAATSSPVLEINPSTTSHPPPQTTIPSNPEDEYDGTTTGSPLNTDDAHIYDD